MLDRCIGWIGAKRLLLVLDNFEHLLGSAETPVTAIAGACPNVMIMLTSRRRLGLRGEHVYPVAPLRLAEPAADQGLQTRATSPAAALFLDRARAIQPELALTAENVRAIQTICTILDGLPLAIELVVRWLTILSPAELADRLSTAVDSGFLHFLQGGVTDLPPRHKALTDVLDWSYGMLSPRQRILFRSLSVFVGGMTVEAAEFVMRGVDRYDGPILDGIQSLVDDSLITRVATPDAGVDSAQSRLRMLRTVHEYAEDKLIAEDEAEELRRAHSAYYLALAESASRRLRSAEQGYWLERIGGEQENLRAAMTWGLEAGPDDITALRIAAALVWYWVLEGQHDEGREWLTAAINRPAPKDPGPAYWSALATAMAGAAALNQRSGDGPSALSWTNSSLNIWRELGDNEGSAYVLAMQSVMYGGRNDIRENLKTAELSVSLFRQCRDPWGLAFALNSLGAIQTVLGDLARARSALTESLALARGVGDAWLLSRILGNLSTLHVAAGDFAPAHDLIVEAVGWQNGLRDIWGFASLTTQLAWLEVHRGEADSAVRWANRAVETARQLGRKVQIARSLAALGMAKRLSGDSASAAEHTDDALTLALESGVHREIAAVQRQAGLISAETGRFPAARLAFEMAVAAARATGLSNLLAASLQESAWLAFREGRLTEAAMFAGAAQYHLTHGDVRPSAGLAGPIQLNLDELRSALGEEAFAAAFAGGESAEAAVSLAPTH